MGPSQNPRIVTHSPTVKLYQVSGDQLDRIEEACSQAGPGSMLAGTSAGIFVTLLVTYSSVDSSSSAHTGYVAGMSVSGVLAFVGLAL